MRKHKVTVVVLIVVTVALMLRLHHLDYESLFMDEIRQVSSYKHSFVQIIYDAATQQQPPLDYWIGHIVNMVDSSDFALRLPSVFWGVGSIALLILLASKACIWPFSAGAGLIMAMLPFHLYFSQEARPYSIVMFLLLIVLWALGEVVGSPSFKIRHFFILLASSTGFLYSSALSPLVITMALIVWLLLLLVLHSMKEGLRGERQKQLMMSIGVLILSCLIYLPVFALILELGGRYAPDASRLDFSVLANGARHFTLAPLWRAYLTQLEPSGLFMLPLVVGAILVAVALPSERQYFLVKTSAFLLPAASFLHIFIFGAKTDLPFRPPYPTYVLPLVLLLASFATQEVIRRVKNARMLRALEPVILLLLGVSLLYTAHSAWAFKSVQKKSDWRGLIAYLESTMQTNHVLILHGLVPLGAWDPTCYGFGRYQKGRSYDQKWWMRAQAKRSCTGISTLQIPGLAKAMTASSEEPVLVLFYYHEYFLTPYSSYPIIPIPSDVSPTFAFGKLESDSSLDVKSFVGFKVVKLHITSGNLAKDTTEIIGRLIQALPGKDPDVAGLHLAAAALRRVLGFPDYADYLDKAMELCPPDYRKYLVPTVAKIRDSQRMNSPAN